MLMEITSRESNLWGMTLYELLLRLAYKGAFWVDIVIPAVAQYIVPNKKPLSTNFVGRY